MNPFVFRQFRGLETRVHELNYLFWECTARCNLSCRHCGSDCNIQGGSKDMPLEDFLRTLDTIPESHRPKGFTVVLTGGEPLLRPDIELVGRSIRQRGFGWGMVSNGYFYDEQMQRRLISAGMGALTISLDGLKESHDWMRGNPDSFSRTVRAVKLACTLAGVAFDVVTCVNKRNLKELPDIYKLLLELGVRKCRLFTIIPIGRAASDAEMSLDASEHRTLMEFIKGKRAEGGPLAVSFSCEEFLGEYEEQVRDLRHFCRAGINIASVLIDGRICACPNIDRDVFSQGSIYTDNFYEVWQTRFGRFRDRSWTKTGPCASCRAWRDCLGGGMHNWHGACDGPLMCYLP